jgi:transposase, IS30 family
LNYRQLTLQDRYQIEAGIALGMSIEDIASQLGRHRSTIFRELRRNGRLLREGYCASSAQLQYHWRRDRGGPRLKIRGQLKRWVDDRIRRKWSPEQITGRLKLEKKGSLGTETVYRYLLRDRSSGGELWKNLRHSCSRRKPRFPHPRWPRSIPRHAAENRPKVIDERRRKGDFERDLIVGKGRSGYLMTLVDRKTKLVRLVQPRCLEASEIHQVTLRAVRGLKVRSLTNDNGVEFVAHKRTSRVLKAPIYFTRPYASWERGTVENTNKLIRQYFRKNASFKEITRAQIEMVQTQLNQRPRKSLGFRSPMEAHFT